jgi:hypothetical protein
MSLMDKTGRNLRVGQLVDCFLSGRFTGEVVAIDEGNHIISNGQQRKQAMVAVSIAVPFPAQGSTCPHVYIVKPAPTSEMGLDDHNAQAEVSDEI